MDPLHVAMAVPWPSWSRTGGVERHVHELATALVQQGLRVTVIVAGPAPPAPAGLPYATVVLDDPRLRAWAAVRARTPIGATVARTAFDRAFGRAAARAAKAAGADLLHRHFVHEDGARPGLPCVYTLHNGDLPRDDPAGGPMVRLDVRRRERGIAAGISAADGVICVSEHVRLSVLGRLGIERDAAVIHNGCPYPAPDRSKAEARRALGLGDERVVLFVGHLWRHKRVLRLLPLLDEPGLQLVLIGRGELEAELRNVADTRHGLRLLGVVDEQLKRLWLRAADVLALPSGSFEGNPIVMMEALRSGTPVHGTMETWLPPALRRFGRFGDVRLALDAMAIDARPAIPLVPDWGEVARETQASYATALESFRRAKR